MAQVTTAVEDEEVVKHFKEVLAPYVIETQLTAGIDSNISPTCIQKVQVQRALREKFKSSQEFIDEFTEMLESGLEGLTKKQVGNNMNGALDVLKVFSLKFTLNEFLRVSDLSMIKFCSSKKFLISKAL